MEIFTNTFSVLQVSKVPNRIEIGIKYSSMLLNPESKIKYTDIIVAIIPHTKEMVANALRVVSAVTSSLGAVSIVSCST